MLGLEMVVVLGAALLLGGLLARRFPIAPALVLVLVGVLIYRSKWGLAFGNVLTSVGLTIPSYALLGVLVGIMGIGVLPSVIMLIFFGFLPILRNVLVGC